MNIDPKHVETIVDALDYAARTIETRIASRPRMSPLLKAALVAEREKLLAASRAFIAAIEQ